MMKIIEASNGYRQKALDLLEKNQLPTQDITASTPLFVALDEEMVVGTIGLEKNSNTALLRSLSVAEDKREKGLGITLVQFIEDLARDHGVQELYLLTTTAEKFFTKRNYLKISRDDVPEFIRHSSEFTGICPASAVIMKKRLA